MTPAFSSSSDGGLAAGRWRSWLAQVGSDARTVERQVVDRSATDGAAGLPQLLVHEVFARAGLEERRSLELLLAVFMEVDEASQLMVMGPAELRARSTAAAAGFLVSEIRLGQALPDMRVSLALLHIERAGRAHDVAVSIESLGRLLDYEYDPEGSSAVAHAIVRRLEVLTAGPGVRVSIAGAVDRVGDSLRGAMHLLTDAALGLDDDIEFRAGRLMIVSGPEVAASSIAVATSGQRGPGRERREWTSGDYALLRFGLAPNRVDPGRPLAQRRVDHALAEVSLGSAVAQQAGSYSSRAASGRQAARAHEILELAVACRQDAAAALLAGALTQPGARVALVESAVAGVGSVAAFWAVLPVVERTIAESAADTESHAVATLLLARLTDRLGQLLRLDPDDASELLIPMTTPIVMEIGDLLYPIVDSRLDGGHFLFRLIRAMRERVRGATGVWIPGVRSRGNPSLPADGYSVQIDEVPVSDGSVDVGGWYRARSLDAGAVPDGAEVAEIHPLTGEPGRWLIEHIADGEATEKISPAEFLAHRLETVIRGHLSAMAGLQEVTGLLDRWRAAEPDLVRRAVGDSAERLMVLLQGLVTERVSIADWQAILDAVMTAGGIGTPLGDLHEAVRHRLRTALPGPRSGPAVLAVPRAIQDDLSGRHANRDPAIAAADRERGRLQFLAWLDGVIREHRSVISLVVDTAATRVTVAALARSERTVVLTFTAEEVGAE